MSASRVSFLPIVHSTRASPLEKQRLVVEAKLALLTEAGAEIEALEAWNVGGSKDKAGEAKTLTGKKITAAGAAEDAWAGLQRLICQFADPGMPYLAEPRRRLAPRYSDYRHLARSGQEEAPDA